MPGIVDIFLRETKDSDYSSWTPLRSVANIMEHFGSIPQLLEDRGVHLGTAYGAGGINIDDFLSLDPGHLPHDTVFELCNCAYLQLPQAIKYQLHTRSNVILHDYMQVLYATKQKHDTSMRYASGEVFGIPTWLLSTVADSYSIGLAKFHISDTPGLALCLNNKPQLHRLNMLEELYQQDLLDQVDWTLAIALPYNHKNNERISQWASDVSHPFVQRFQLDLPRLLHVDSYSDCVFLPQDLVGNYRWYISCETYSDVHFATEKTFKAFLGCMAPLTVAPAGFNKYLEELGFQMPGNYDHLEGEERIQAIAQLLKTDLTDYTNLIKHNYELVTNNKAISECLTSRIAREYTL